jgi:hypothetical protein
MTSEAPADAGSTGRAGDLGMLSAYFGLTFGLAWAAWIPAAVFFSNVDQPGLPKFASGLVVLQSLGAVAPTVSAYLILRLSGRRDLLKWIPRPGLR